MKINDHELLTKEYQGQRMLTLRDVDVLHGKATDTARKCFNRHRNRLKNGKDYFVVDSHQAKELYGITAPRGLITLTASGYSVIAESFVEDGTMNMKATVMKQYFGERVEDGEDETKTETVEINDYPLPIRTYKGKRVVTFKDIDSCHGRPKGTTRRNFNTNKEHFVEGEDYFVISADEIRTHKITDLSNKAHENIILITEFGYLMLTKSFTDDLAWKVQRMLVESYFRTKQETWRCDWTDPEDRDEIIERNLKDCYLDWCIKLRKPLNIIQRHYELFSQTAALARVYYLFSEIHGYNVDDVRESYIQNERDKHEDSDAWAERTRNMAMLKFIHRHPRFKDEIDRLTKEMAAKYMAFAQAEASQRKSAELTLS